MVAVWQSIQFLYTNMRVIGTTIEKVTIADINIPALYMAILYIGVNGIFASYLLVASITDSQTCKVYDFLHPIGVIPGLFILILKNTGMDVWISLILFCLIQYFIFKKLYGWADGLGFIVCAIYESIRGGRMLTYLLHMTLAFIIFGTVQGIRHNINKKGNLKVPAPFFPYIAFTVWIFL